MRFSFFLIILASFTHIVVAQNFDIVATAAKASIVYAADGKKLDSIAAHLLAADLGEGVAKRCEVARWLGHVSSLLSRVDRAVVSRVRRADSAASWAASMLANLSPLANVIVSIHSPTFTE